ncbi:MAG TPA: hypothetical protein DCE52_11655 [Rhodobacteraceae bacterium]|nr:hypothetical protein [Alphaproteobacteria bacterium]MDA9224054.1 PA14 domain-containing protein [Tateyamaria sp.]HAB38630.1 hypothetical protein [Paracoccaceae bacterium]MCH9832699.1 hypothetical protein [Alphaproteobacteria bacterium]MDG0982746.1 PA14 domain-containing protein [Tateyamaria sp.]
MTLLKTMVAILLMTIITTTAFADPLKLKLASPQPSDLKSGLAVKYAYPLDVKNLKQATRALKYAEPGSPLAGLDYRDTANGDLTLTSTQAHNVVAIISGYVNFDASGVYTIDFLTNDGLDASIGGQQVGYFNGRQSCNETKPVQVEVPKAGWYELKAIYFQRVGSSCLHMRAGKGSPDWMPNSAFGYN